MIGNDWWTYLLWLLVAGGLGLAVTSVFSDWLGLRRAWFLIPYTLLISAFLYAYVRWSGLDIVARFRRNCVWGVVGACVLGFLMVRNVLSQPASTTPEGAKLVSSLAWFGVVYGTLDGLFLSVMPVMATWQLSSHLGWTRGWLGQIAVGLLTLGASAYVTAAYHLGYPEFRGTEALMPVLGNSIMSLGYLVTGNPLAAVVSHAAMHLAAVLHGMETTIQLPPHY